MPDDVEIAEYLRRVVRDAIQNEDDITIKIARSRVEQELGLDEGWFKEHKKWNKRSKDIINATVEEPSPEKPKPKPVPQAGTKRKSDEVQHGKKKAKKEPIEDSDIEEDAGSGAVDVASDVEDKPSKPQPKSEEESSLSDPPEDEEEPAPPKPNDNANIDDESELSSVIDDAPPKKKRQRKPSSPSASKTKSKPENSHKVAKATKSKPEKEISPDEEEIKKLQSWLMKCGIRKLWHRELAHCSTSKDKIKHLKQMLEDVGMTGRFSAEKARQIREARELAAELDAAKEFNEQWGQRSGDEDDEEKEGGEKKEVPKRLKPKGLIDFGDSDDGSD